MTTNPIGGVPLTPLVALPETTTTASSVLTNQVTQQLPGAPASTAPLPTLLPAGGTDSDTQALLDTLLEHFNQQAPATLRLLSAQKWPMELARQVLSTPTHSPAVLPDKLAQWLPTLQPWLAQQGTWQTHQGSQGFAATLYVPGPWLTQQAPTQQPLQPVRIATEQGNAMASIALALVLSNAEGETLSALLTLEFGSARHTLPYGRDLFTPRQDPWVQQAMLLAHEPRSRVTARQTGADHLCQETQCPYHHRAECPQPFCPWHLHVPAIVPAP